MTGDLRDDQVTTTIHLSGPVVTFLGRARQRCVWCGYVITDDELARMAYPLNPDGSDPGPPPRGFAEGVFLEITLDPGGFRGTSIVEAEPSEDGQEGHVKVPTNCCMWLPAELTGGKE